MNKIIDTRFERVEVALKKLIDSITAYNPNPNLATELVSADANLSSGLEECLFPPLSPFLLGSFSRQSAGTNV